MATTPNYGFILHENNEFFDIEHFNAMMTSVDTELARVIARFKPEKIQTTMPASSWTGTTAPFTTRIAINGLKSVHNVDVGVSESATDEQILSLVNASILTGHTEDGYLVLEAYGDKPETDLPIVVIVRGDISETGIISDDTVISGGTFADWSE